MRGEKDFGFNLNEFLDEFVFLTVIFYIKIWLSSVLHCIQVAYVCTGLVYIIYVCACACVYQSDSLPTQQQRGVTEGLPLRWQTVWSSKICLFSLTGCQSASVFFPPLHSPCLHPSLSFCIPFQWNEKGWALVSMRNCGIIVSVSCLSLQCIRTDLSCQTVTVVRGWDVKTSPDLSRGK